jgi:hypothetical protein
MGAASSFAEGVADLLKWMEPSPKNLRHIAKIVSLQRIDTAKRALAPGV